jgi:hypothetical protein
MSTEQPATQRRRVAPVSPAAPDTRELHQPESLAELEQVIERHSVKFTAEVQGLRAELDQRLHALGVETGASRQMSIASEPAPLSRGHPPRYGWWTHGWQQGQLLRDRYVIVLWLVWLIVGIGIGVVVAFALS